jgi:hypothetical protein
MYAVVWASQQLWTVTNLSHRRKLPVVFWG